MNGQQGVRPPPQHGELIYVVLIILAGAILLALGVVMLVFGVFLGDSIVQVCISVLLPGVAGVGMIVAALRR